jgi:hypothetical protein
MIAAAALNGSAISWVDPHRGMMLTFCDTHEVPVAR